MLMLACGRSISRARSHMACAWSEFHRGVEGMHTLSHRGFQRQSMHTFERLPISSPPWSRTRVCLTVPSTTRSREAPASRRLFWKQVVKHRLATTWLTLDRRAYLSARLCQLAAVQHLAQSDHMRCVYLPPRGRLYYIRARVASSQCCVVCLRALLTIPSHPARHIRSFAGSSLSNNILQR